VPTDYESLREELAPVFEGDTPDNVLGRLSVGNDERPHTHILEWLLDPSAGEEHGGEVAFQRSFVEQVDVQLNDPRIETFQGRLGDENAEIDLIARDRDTCVGVEIKTTHKAGESQLEREHRALLTEFHRLDTHRLVYLSRDPDHEPGVEFDEYQRLTWTELVEGFNVDAADQEWRGFLTHLFDHIKTTVMKQPVRSVADMSDEAEKAEFFAHTIDFVDEAEDAYWNVLLQFFRDVCDEIQDLGEEQWMPDDDDPWNNYDWMYHKNDDKDLDNNYGNPKSLSIYNRQWPHSMAGDDDTSLTARFQIIRRGHDSSPNSTAQLEGVLTSEFGMEVNFDIYCKDDLELQDDVRSHFIEALPNDTLGELQNRGYAIDASRDATYHIFGRLFESEWPPDQDNIDEVIKEYEWLVKAVHQTATEVFQEKGMYHHKTPDFGDDE